MRPADTETLPVVLLAAPPPFTPPDAGVSGARYLLSHRMRCFMSPFLLLLSPKGHFWSPLFFLCKDEVLGKSAVCPAQNHGGC